MINTITSIGRITKFNSTKAVKPIFVLTRPCTICVKPSIGKFETFKSGSQVFVEGKGIRIKEPIPGTVNKYRGSVFINDESRAKKALLQFGHFLYIDVKKAEYSIFAETLDRATEATIRMSDLERNNNNFTIIFKNSKGQSDNTRVELEDLNNMLRFFSIAPPVK